MTEAFGWLAVWGIVGLLATARIAKDDEHYTFSWRFQRDEPLKIFAAGPVVWALVAMRWWL